MINLILYDYNEIIEMIIIIIIIIILSREDGVYDNHIFIHIYNYYS